MSLFGSGGGDAAAQAQKQEAQREASISQGMTDINSQFSSFTPDFYNKAAQGYENYATPQAMQQYQKTKNSLADALARNGITQSTAAATEGQSLNNELSTNLNTIANTGQNTANTLESNVSAQKSNIVNELEASADPSAASVAASSAVAGLQAPPAYQPLGNMFSDWTSTYLANMNAQSYNPNQASIWSMLSGGGGGGQTSQTGNSVIVP